MYTLNTFHCKSLYSMCFSNSPTPLRTAQHTTTKHKCQVSGPDPLWVVLRHQGPHRPLTPLSNANYFSHCALKVQQYSSDTSAGKTSITMISNLTSLSVPQPSSASDGLSTGLGKGWRKCVPELASLRTPLLHGRPSSLWPRNLNQNSLYQLMPLAFTWNHTSSLALSQIIPHTKDTIHQFWVFSRKHAVGSRAPRFLRTLISLSFSSEDRQQQEPPILHKISMCISKVKVFCFIQKMIQNQRKLKYTPHKSHL